MHSSPTLATPSYKRVCYAARLLRLSVAARPYLVMVSVPIRDHLLSADNDLP